MGHTPGPWKYLPPQAVGGAAIIPEKGPEITDFWNRNPDLRSEDEHRCNALLVAAAPDLFLGTQRMLSVLRMGALIRTEVPAEFWVAADLLQLAYRKAIGAEEL